MKKLNSLLFAFCLAVILSAGTVRAQNIRIQPDSLQRQQQSSPPDNNQQTEQRPNLLQLLNLTPDQVQQIRAVNQATRGTVRAANMRQREARRALDAAIYADAPNQAEVDQRVRELTVAQAAAITSRTNVEFQIRQILAPEQLLRFRELRRQFAQKMNQRLPLQPRRLRQPNNKPL